jgi:adenylate kinase
MIIIVSGTPGTGKTTLARELAKSLDYPYLDVKKLIKSKGLSIGIDQKRKCEMVDIGKMNKLLIGEIKKAKNLIIDSHLSHYLPREWVDKCIITRCEIKELQSRLKKRRYTKAKIRENLDSEIFELCLNEAREAGHKVCVFDTTKGIGIKKVIKRARI